MVRSGPPHVRVRVDRLVYVDGLAPDRLALLPTGWEVDLRMPCDLDLRRGDEIRTFDVRVRVRRVDSDGIAHGTRPRVVGDVPPDLLRGPPGGGALAAYPPEFPDSHYRDDG